MNFVQALENQLPNGYSVSRKLGAGATSWVYLAESASGEIPLVVKALHPGITEPQRIERFLQEMRILDRLDHPRIVRILFGGRAMRTPFFVMPYIEGETLRGRLRRHHTLAVCEALAIARDVADALAHVHRNGIVHRDVKPENIFLGPDGAYLTDFGFAHAPALATSHAIAANDGIVGTHGYMSPEQASGTGTADWRSDYFGLGCVLYEMLAGKSPIRGASPEDRGRDARLASLPDLRASRPDAPPEVAEAIRQLLASSSTMHFPTSAAVRDAIERLIACSPLPL